MYHSEREETNEIMDLLYKDDRDFDRWHVRGFSYTLLYHRDRDNKTLMTMMIMVVSCFIILDLSNDRFPYLLLRVLVKRLLGHLVFGWVPMLLVQIYRELWGFRAHRRYDIIIGFILNCWVYDHIQVLRSMGLSWEGYA